MGCRLTAMGAVSALGINLAEMRRTLASGVQPLAETEESPHSRRPTVIRRVAGNITEFPLSSDFSDPRISGLESRNSQLLLMALSQIETEAINLRSRFGADRIAVVLGSSTSGISNGEAAVRHRREHGILPAGYSYLQQEMGCVAEVVARALGIYGPTYTLSTACSSSAKVFQSGRALLELGLADAVIVGGGDSLCQMTVEGFAALELLAPTASNPFSANRCGINVGEGACLFLLTRDAGGVQLLGVGESSDAHHMSAPDPEGRGAQTAMATALRDAGIRPAQISYLNLHGTGTPANDLMEGRAVSNTLPSCTPCSSTKPLTGHTLGASGALEVGVCWLMIEESLQSGRLPLPWHCYDGSYCPTIPKLTLVEEPAELSVSGETFCMSNSFGFGGSNCSVILGAKT